MTGADFVAGAETPIPCRNSWTPPVWTFYNATAGVSIDVQADTEAAAATAAAAAFDAALAQNA